MLLPDECRQAALHLDRGALCMNLEDLCASLEVREAKLDLTVEPAWPQKGRIEGVRPIGGHEDLDIPPGIESIQLVDDLEHRPLHLIVPSGAIIEARTPDRIDLVKEYDACLLGPRHLYQHPTLAT